jgi:uncharacterized RDD family membrane protein YckC
VRLLLTPAGPAARAWAWLIDFVVWLVAAGFLAKLLLPTRLGTGLYAIALFLTYWGYPVICEVYFGGRTLGKRALGLEVRRADGLPVGWRESMLRNLMLVADFLPFMYVTGLVAMLCDSRCRRLGDLVAGTQVVYRERAPKWVALTAVEPQPLPYSLTPEQQAALTGLFEREASLSIARLHELSNIAEPLTGTRDAASLQRLRAFAAGLMQ